MGKKIFILILIIAFGIRIIALNQSLWLDEAIVWKVVKTSSYWQILKDFSPHDFHPPLYYFLMKAWTGLVGYSEIALRFPSVFFSVLSGISLFFSFGFWPAAFFLFNPLIVYYSQEARMYALSALFIVISICALKEDPRFEIVNHKKNAIRKSKVFKSVLLGISLSLAFMTFYGTIFFSLSILNYLLIKRHYTTLLTTTFLLVLTILLLSPLLYLQLQNAKLALVSVAHWKLVLGTVSMKNLLLVFIKFMSGRISFEPNFFYFAIAGLWSLITWSLVIRGGVKDRKHLFLFVSCVLFTVLFSFVTPMLQYFRLLFLLPLIVILLDKGIHSFILKSIVLVVFFGWSLLYLLFPQFHREDWKALSQELDPNIPVVMITDAQDPLDYYLRRFTIYDIRKGTDLKNLKQVNVINYNMDIYGINYKGILETEGYTFKKSNVVRGIEYASYFRKMTLLR